jgi:hypothetical protein
LLLDPIGLLSDDTWLGFLRSGFTGHARPQRGRCRTWIAVACVCVWLVAVVSLDVVRLRRAIGDRDETRATLGQSIETISALYQLDFILPRLPSNAPAISGLIVRLSSRLQFFR